MKILIEFPGASQGEIEVESLWAIPDNNYYKIDNIPFYAKGFALDDIVSIQKHDNCLYVDKLVKASGHSTVRIWFFDSAHVAETRESLSAMGCATEISDVNRLIAVDIPPSVSYAKVKSYLDMGEFEGKWEYQEACLAQ